MSLQLRPTRFQLPVIYWLHHELIIGLALSTYMEMKATTSLMLLINVGHLYVYPVRTTTQLTH